MILGNCRKQIGTTLIEVLISVLIIGVSAVAILRFQSFLAYDTSLAHQRADAANIAESQFETLREFQVLNDTPGYTSYQSITSGSTNVTSGNTTYSVTWTVTTNTSPDYKDVTITVSWTDRYGASQSVSLSGRIAGIDPGNSATVM